MTEKFPRRYDLDRMTTEEKLIRNAMLSIEDFGCSPHLTDAVVLLQQAQAKVADYVDEQIEKASK